MKQNDRNFSNHGMTLVEVIVSAAILAIVAMILVTVMAQALRSLSETRKRTNAAMSTAANIEAQRAASSSGDTSSDMTINFSAGPEKASGTIITVSNPSGKPYLEFVPK